MVDIPRIITLDPTGAAGRALRSALVLLDVSCTHVDVPSVGQAMLELNAEASLLIAAYALDYDNGPMIAAAVSASRPEVGVIVLADEDDPTHEAEAPESGAAFVVLRRPFDPTAFIRAIEAAMEGRSVREAIQRPAQGAAVVTESAGLVPPVDAAAVGRVLERLQSDVGAMAIFLTTRTGQLVTERGMPTSTLKKDQLINTLAPTLAIGRGMKDVVGGQLSSLQFYDGDEYDVFVLTAGLHHLICIVYDGDAGQRNFGAVNRFGRKAAEDVIALIGAGAFIWETVRTVAEPAVRRTMHIKPVKLDEPLEIPLARAVIDESAQPQAAPEEPALEPIEDLDLDVLFGNDLEPQFDDLFDPDALGTLAQQPSQGKGKLSWDQAKEIGLLP
jgi:DNA-binding NarL/FixJ family response regulator